jgi:hypothetical protein
MTVERVDDIPVLLHHLSTMPIAAMLDQSFPTHGNWTGEASLGAVAVGWLSFIVTEGDHGLSQVESWAEEHQATLSAGLGQAMRPLDFQDDRLADILSALAPTERWTEFETALMGQLLRVYALDGDRVWIDSTTGKTYAGVRPDGRFQFGHSKDHRPDWPQVKINLSALDPLGLPLTTTIVGGQSADDPLYVPEIQRVQRILGVGGKTYIGDGKMGALATRAYVAYSRDYYLCPLAGPQMPAAQREAFLIPQRFERLDLLLTGQFLFQRESRGGGTTGFLDLPVDFLGLALQAELQVVSPAIELLSFRIVRRAALGQLVGVVFGVVIGQLHQPPSQILLPPGG